MSGPRAAKMAAAIQKELAILLREEVKDPRFHAAGLVTVTQVLLSPDLRVATVLVSFAFGEDGVVESALRGLDRMSGFLRGEVGRRLGLKRSPELRFKHDRSAEHVAQIDRLLRGEEGPND
ncbi:MAG: 30S ribosome-binding factor RbfA [Deltaproteobacteria bacterium]|nr:30S ribosome-binding factor RbfA [Deltaproteobacteria bacterium]